MTLNLRNCPDCGQEIQYKTKYRRNWAEKNKLICNTCSVNRMLDARTITAPKPPIQRNCPSCKTVLTYTDRANGKRAIRNKSLCTKCAVRHSAESNEKRRKTMTGKKFPNRASNCKKGKELPFKRPCPNCTTELSYKSQYGMDRASKANSVCNSCSNKIYKKSWTHVITDEHVKKMAAKKAGYDTFTEYMADLDNRKKYFREVRKITRQQDITQLENFDKLRGLCGVEDAYQLDHIISVSAGYDQKIPATHIGHISNLQIIPWKDNLLKSNHSI